MPFPKISTVLNNCPLHAITPELKREILNFRDIAHYDNHHNANFLLLKQKFALFYGFNPETFTWEHFADILEEYNAFDTQIILGPVLREFMVDQLPSNEEIQGFIFEDMTAQQWKDIRTKIRPHTGRYESLSPDELFGWVCKPLGFDLRYSPENGDVTNYKCHAHPISRIDIYHHGGREGAHQGGHWERTVRGEGSINAQNRDDTQLNPFLLLIGEDARTNPAGFNLLKQHVRLTHRKIVENNDHAVATAQLIRSATLIEEYIFNIANVPQSLAIQLLGKNLPQDVREFIDSYPFHPVPSQQIYERWVYAELHNELKPPLDERENHVAQRLVARLRQENNMPQVHQQQPSDEHPMSVRLRGRRHTSPYERALDAKLRTLWDKVENLGQRCALEKQGSDEFKRLEAAAEAALRLFLDISQLKDTYFELPNPSEKDTATFKLKCKQKIDDAKKILDPHRGWSEFLVNLVLFIGTLTLGFIGKGLYNLTQNRNFLFVHKTASSAIADDILDEINRIDPPASGMD